MLKIRNEQLEVLEQAAVRSFEDRMVEHLKRFAPGHFKILKEEDIRGCVRLGVERAQTYGLISERSVRIYVQTMFMLGSSFDTDPQYPWAAEMLGDEEQGAAERSDRLHDKSWDYAAHVAEDYKDLDVNADHSRLIQELRGLRQGRDEELSLSSLPDFHARTIAWLKKLLPAKCAYVGELPLRRLVQRGVESARGHGLTTERGVLLFVALMFVAGGGFDTDPQLPWASAVLNDETTIDQNERVNRLYAAALDCLRRWWA
jgi:hypothetical protein